jgi:hypothetical protein
MLSFSSSILINIKGKNTLREKQKKMPFSVGDTLGNCSKLGQLLMGIGDPLGKAHGGQCLQSSGRHFGKAKIKVETRYAHYPP